MPIPRQAPPEALPTATWHSLEADGLLLRYLTVEGAQGDAWLIFHGFGQKILDWAEAATLLSHLGRVILIELPGHGLSKVLKENRAISIHAWEHWLLALCRKERVHTCNLLGYSLGGKLALSSLYVLKGRVEQIVLCAAEGGTPSIWYQFATGTPLGRRLLKQMVFKPGWLLTSIRTLSRLGIVNKSVARFATSQLHTRAKRTLVARSWLSLRTLPPSPAEIAEVVNDFSIPFYVVAGKYDRVVPLKRMVTYANMIPHAKIEVLPVGHNQLPLATVHFLMELEMDSPKKN
jgi:pimeloyl-ACP methyl ester carboxylesterase